MEYVDLTHAALRALQPSPSSTKVPYDHDIAHELRGKILGVLIRRGRLAAQRSTEDCASFLRIDANLVEAWELGDKVPSLPQLEGLTDFLKTPVSKDAAELMPLRLHCRDEYLLLRQRLIGAKLQFARRTQEQTLHDLSASTGFAVELLRSYEYGQAMIPLNHLTVLAQAVRRDLSYFVDSECLNGNGAQSNIAHAIAADHDADLIGFAADNENRAFIRLAMAFRHIEKEDLHRIADALFVIINERREANGRSPTPS